MPDKFTDLTEFPVTDRGDAGTMQALTGQNVQIVRSEVRAGEVFEPHRHSHEQFVLVLEGAIEFEIDGERRTLGPSGVFYFEPDCLHGARVPGPDPVRLLEIFSPPRDDYRGDTAVSGHSDPR